MTCWATKTIWDKVEQEIHHTISEPDKSEAAFELEEDIPHDQLIKLTEEELIRLLLDVLRRRKKRSKYEGKHVIISFFLG